MSKGKHESPKTVSTEQPQALPLKTKRQWSSAIMFTLSLAVFYAQGRLYHEGFLRYFGINPSQFPVSTADAYWYALNSWATLVGKGVPTIWSIYPEYLWSLRYSMALLLAALVLIWWGNKRDWWVRVRAWVLQQRAKPRGEGSGIIFAMSMTILWVLATPFFLILGMLIIALLLTTLVVPYETLGKVVASDLCQSDATNYPLVRYEGDEYAGKAPSARLIQCGTDNCLLIRDGEAYVIRKEFVRWTGGVPLPVVRASKKAHEVPEVMHVPPQAQLCYRPEPAKT